MNELQVNTESLYQEAEKTVESIRKLKQILERQRNIINKMGGYWNGEGYEAATKNYMELSDEEKSEFRNKNIGFIPQSPALLSYLNVLENIRLPYDMYEKDGDSEGKARYFLNELGLEHLAKSYPKELSGGELRRIIIARALMTEPKILIADEPTSDLDIEATKEVMDLLKKINEKGTTVLVVTHELDTLKYGKKVYTMSEGILEDGKKL